MAVYAVGDVQGCAAELDELLEELRFDPAHDRLWFVGDLVNRGPRFARRAAPRRRAAATRRSSCSATTTCTCSRWPAASAAQGGDRRPCRRSWTPPTASRLLDWLQSAPAAASRRGARRHDGACRAAAAVGHCNGAIGCARELEAELRGQPSGRFSRDMYGDKPDLWRDDLEGDARLRFIVNCLYAAAGHAMRDGRARWASRVAPINCPTASMPWFRVPGRRTAGARIVCGHWSALGYLDENGVASIDTGCVWGGSLTALRLDRPAGPVQVPASKARELPAED